MKNKKMFIALGLCVSLSLSGCGGVFKAGERINQVGKLVSAIRHLGGSDTPDDYPIYASEVEPDSESSDWDDESQTDDYTTEESESPETESQTESTEQETAQKKWKYADRLVALHGNEIFAEDELGNIVSLGEIYCKEDEYVGNVISYGDDLLYFATRSVYDGYTYHTYMDLYSYNTGEMLYSIEAYSINWIVEDDGLAFYYTAYVNDENIYEWYQVDGDEKYNYTVTRTHQDKSDTLRYFDGNPLSVYSGIRWMGANDNIYVLGDESHIDVYAEDGKALESLELKHPFTYLIDISERGMVYSYSQSMDDSYYRYNYQYIFYDFDTKEEVELGSFDSEENKSIQVASMIGNKIYYFIVDNSEYGRSKETAYVYDIDAGKNSFLFENVELPGQYYDEQLGPNYFATNGERVLYAADAGKKACWNVIEENGSTTETGVDAFAYRVLQYGSVEDKSKTYHSDAIDKDVFRYCIDTFRFDTSDPGVEKINKSLNKYYKECVAYAKDSAEKAMNDAASGEGWFDYEPYSYEVSISNVREIGTKYYGVDFGLYEYWGGAHGMPYVEYLVYDKETGKKVHFLDLYKGSEEEMKDIVARYTVDDWVNGEDPYRYYGWDSEANAYAAFYEMIDKNMCVRLDEDCAVFIYPPYAVGPFASGFIDVAIPYSELGIEMK